MNPLNVAHHSKLALRPARAPRGIVWPALAVALFLCASGAHAADGAARPAAPPVTAVRVTDRISVDGVLSEPVWSQGSACTSFFQRVPREGAAATLRTEVRVAYDDDALYVGARMYDPAPDSILARLTRRDASVASDRFALYLDPYHDRRTGYYFMVNAAGTMYDGTLSNDVKNDKSWDGVWAGRARVDEDGWSVEMRIPFSQMRIDRAGSPVWGVNFARIVPRRLEEDFVAYRPRKEGGFVSRFPELEGLDHITPGPAVEIIPYATSRGEYVAHDPGDPFNDGSEVNWNGGADLRMGVASKLTLNATINPDFGQVEVDPEVVNLTDVETFLDEKRPFFVEGASTFEFGRSGGAEYWDYDWSDPLFFYSRRIGREPQGDVPHADYKDVPAGTRILGAVKLIGHLTPDWNFGTIQSVTDREMASLSNEDGHSWNSEVEPLSYYGVARAERSYDDRRFGIGFIGTAAARRFDEAALSTQLPRASFLGGVDGWAYLDPRRTWILSGWTSGTYVRGFAAQIEQLQTNSVHYFQRPDAGHVEVDPGALSLAGWGSRYWINKEKGAAQFNAAFGTLSPGYEANDLGYQERADIVNAHVGTGYKWTNPGRFSRFQSLKVAAYGNWDFGGNALAHGAQLTGYTEFNNNATFSYYGSLRPQSLDNRRTRGGPLTVSPTSWTAGAEYQTDTQHSVYYYLQGDAMGSESGTQYLSAYPAVEWKPTAAVNFKIGPGFERLHEDAQYVTTESDPAATETFGNRYVFGTLDQTSVSAVMELNWTFTPKLSLETYTQPYISSGSYTNFRSLVRPRSYEFAPYAYGDNPDFTVFSLKGDAVLRWEYRPGSLLYLVWTQQRYDENASGTFDLPSSLHHVTGLNPENVFMVKLTHYFTP
jgi:uncharacterized protein DUF5916/cellulose/xylan binding protein with CBM9 domain